MIDGSMMPIAENIALTQQHKLLAKPLVFPWKAKWASSDTVGALHPLIHLPEEAAAFERATSVDALAISVGNVHLQTKSRLRLI